MTWTNFAERVPTSDDAVDGMVWALKDDGKGKARHVELGSSQQPAGASTLAAQRIRGMAPR